MSIPLVGPATPGSRAAGTDQIRGYGDNRRFRAPRFVQEGDRITQLDHLVAVGSTDVRVHLERLNIHISAGAEEKAYGATVDLFIASGPTAHEVRSRALFWAGSLLTAEHRRALHAYVTPGLSAATPMPSAPHSLLSLGVTGSLELVGRADGRPAAAAPKAPAPRQEPDLAPLPTPQPTPVTNALASSTPTTPVRGPRAIEAAAPVEVATPAPAPASAPAEAPAGVPTPRSTPAADVKTFDPDRTIIRFVKRYTSLPTTPTHAWYVSAPFGQCAIWGNSVWFQVEDESRLADELAASDLEVKRIDALQLDSSQAQSARIVLWNLGAYVSGGRLPADVPTDTLLALRNWPDLTRVARIREDTKLAAMLSRRPLRVSDLPDRPNVRAFLAAAWVSGALVRVDAAAARTATQHGSSLNGHALRGLVSRLRRKAE